MNSKLQQSILNYFRETFGEIDYNYDDLADWEKEIFSKEDFDMILALLKIQK